MRIKFNLKGASAATNQLVPSSSSSSSSAVVVAPPLGYEATVSLSSEESQSLLSAGITKQQEKAAREAEAYRLVQY